MSVLFPIVCDLQLVSTAKTGTSPLSSFCGADKFPTSVQVMQNAISPDRATDPESNVTAMASVTEVSISGDLQVAKVYISVYSDEEGKARAMKRLTGLEG